MDLWFEQFLAKSTTITVYHDVAAPLVGFTTTTVSQGKEELGPGWAMDDVYPPLAELRRALLTDEEWAAMSSWEKDVWEMYYRPDWERLACIEQILVDTPATQRAQKHEEILEALRNLGMSASKPASAAAANSCSVHISTNHGVHVDTASSAVAEEGHEVTSSALTGFITTVPVTCLTDCSPQHSSSTSVLVASSSPTLTCSANCVTQVITALSPAPATTTTLLWTSPLEGITKFRSHGRLLRPMPWPSFWAGQLTATENRPSLWPSFTSSRGCERQRQCLGVLPQTHVQYASNGLEEMHVCIVYAVEQSESQLPTKFHSEPSKDFRYACSSATGFSDFEWLRICTPNNSICWESDFVLDINMIHVAAVPLAMMAELPAVTTPTNSAPKVQLQHSESLMSTSSRCIATKVPLHPPMPWSFFVSVPTDGNEARPLPWPSFRKINGCEFSNDVIEKSSGLHISDSFHEKEPEHYFFSCQPRESSILTSVRPPLSSYDQFSCAIHDASSWPGNFLISSHMLVSDACSTWQLFLSVIQPV